MVYLTLSAVHECLTFWTHSTGPSGRTSLANAWTGPAELFSLASEPLRPHGLTFAESIGSSVLMFWVWLFVALLGAYLLSFFVSINTIMYYLLRYEVDATDIDDVYLEPGDDDFEDPLPESAAGTVSHMPSGPVPSSAMTERVGKDSSTPPAPPPPPVTDVESVSPPPPAESPVETPKPTDPPVNPADSAETPPTPPPAGS